MSVVAPIAVDAFLGTLRSQLGVHENPANSNKQPYGAEFGMNGVAWCDIFQWWCLKHAGWTDVPKFSYTPSHADWFKKNGAWLPASAMNEAPVGSLLFFNFGKPNRISHVGAKEGMVNSSTVATIEGNTNDAGGRTGGMVMRHNRTVAGGIVGFGVITFQNAPSPQSSPTPPAGSHDTLSVSGRLTANQALVSANGRCMAVYQSDGNFVVYADGKAIWSSKTNGISRGFICPQSDGNLVVYNASGHAVWASGTRGSVTRLVMQDDGNLVLYAGNKALWASKQGKL